MADVKISGLPAITAIDDDDLMTVVEDGVSKQITMSQLTTYFEARGRSNNASVAQQTWGGSEAYLVNSNCAIPNNPSGGNRLQAKAKYLCRFYVAKTSAAGTATPIINIKIGTNGTTADSTRATLTFAAQTAVADEGRIDVEVTFRTVGSGTTAIIRAQGTLDHRLASTGLANVNTSIVGNTGSGFDSTVQNTFIGLSVNWGTSFVGTTDLVQAELLNLA